MQNKKKMKMNVLKLVPENINWVFKSPSQRRNLSLQKVSYKDYLCASGDKTRIPDLYMNWRSSTEE